MKKKIIYLVIILLGIATFWLVNQSIGKNDTVLQKVKLIIPISIRNKLKETIFVFKNPKKIFYFFFFSKELVEGFSPAIL